MRGTRGREEVRGASFAGSSPPFLGRERAAVDFDVAVRSVARDDEGKVGEWRWVREGGFY